jgi:hypothetical protein
MIWVSNADSLVGVLALADGLQGAQVGPQPLQTIIIIIIIITTITLVIIIVMHQ